MSLTLVQVVSVVGRRTLTAVALGLIGLIVGFGCVLLPPAVPFMIVGLAVVILLWVLPELQALPYTWARAMTPVFLVTFICVPVYYAIILPGAPWIQIRRVVQILWLVPIIIMIAGSAKARDHITKVMHASPVLRGSVLGYIIYTIITIPTAVYLAVSSSFVFNSFLNWYLPMFGVMLLVRDSETAVKLFKLSFLAVAVNLVVGAVEFHLQRPFLIYALPGFMRDQIFAASGIAADILTNGQGVRDGVYRASATYTTALSWGENCAMLIPFALHFIAHGKSWSEKAFGILGSVLCFSSVVLSGSRGGYVSMIAATVCYSICWSFRSNIMNKGSLIGKIALTLFSMASAATLLAIFFVGRLHRLIIGGGQGQMSTDSRAAEWAQAKPKIFARPLLGYGGGSAGDIIHYPSSRGGFSVDGYHMNLLVDFGVPGFLFFFATFMIAGILCIRLYLTRSGTALTIGNAYAASILAFFTYRWTLSQVDNMTLAFMIIGLVFVYINTSAEGCGNSAVAVYD